MPRRRLAFVAAVAALVAASLLGVAPAQSREPGSVTTSLSLSGLAQFDASLDRGGSVRWDGVQASASVTRQFTAEVAAGLLLRYDYQHWTFDNPSALGGLAPWSNLSTPLIGLNFTYAPTSEWRLGFNPAVDWSGESGAGAGDSLSYGAVLTATKTLAPDLALGIGAGIFRQIDETKVFPFVVVNWKIDERLRLVNPLPAGPAGGAGLELAWTLGDRWELGGGGSYRSYRFRLNDDGPIPNGIGENRLFPLFVRLSYTFDSATRADLYAVTFVGGKLSVTRADGSDVYHDDYGVAPAIALSLSHRF